MFYLAIALYCIQSQFFVVPLPSIISFFYSDILHTVGLNDNYGLQNELAKLTIKYNLPLTDFHENLNILIMPFSAIWCLLNFMVSLASSFRKSKSPFKPTVIHTTIRMTNISLYIYTYYIVVYILYTTYVHMLS